MANPTGIGSPFRHATPEEVAERHQTLTPVFDLMAHGVLTGAALDCYGLNRMTLNRWVTADDTLNRRYLNARTAQAAALAEKALEVAAQPVLTMQEATQRRTYVDTLRWAASKLDPSRWADKLLVEETHTKVVRHVVMLPPRQGPPPAIVGGGKTKEIAVIGPPNRESQRAIPETVTPNVTDPAIDAAPSTDRDDADHLDHPS